MQAACYTWTISEPKLLNQIKNAKSNQRFKSDTIILANSHWKIVLIPNGWDQRNIGSFYVGLSLISLPETWNDITIMRRLQSPQTHSSDAIIQTYTVGTNNGPPNYWLSLNEVKHLKQMIFIITVKPIRITLVNNNTLFYQHQFIYPRSKKMQWKIDLTALNALKYSPTGKLHASNIYDSLWVIEISPNGHNKTCAGNVDVALNLVSLPANVHELEVQWKASCNALYNTTSKIHRFKRGLGRSFALVQYLSFPLFKTLSDVTIIMDVEILAEYDENGKEIEAVASEPSNDGKEQKTQGFVDDEKQLYEAQMQSFQQNIEEKLEVYDAKLESMLTNYQGMETKIKKMEDLLAKSVEIHKQKDEQIQLLTTQVTRLLEEENKTDGGNKVMSQIEKLQKQMVDINAKITSIKGVKTPQSLSIQEKLKIFLEHEVELIEYYDLFIDNGFESIESLYDITHGELKEVGVTKLGHRKKLIKAIDSKQTTDNTNDGTTPYI